MRVFNRYVLACRHVLVNSFLLFRELRCGSHRMKYFSVVQRLHFLLEFEYGLARATNIFYY